MSPLLHCSLLRWGLFTGHCGCCSSTDVEHCLFVGGQTMLPQSWENNIHLDDLIISAFQSEVHPHTTNQNYIFSFLLPVYTVFMCHSVEQHIVAIWFSYKIVISLEYLLVILLFLPTRIILNLWTRTLWCYFINEYIIITAVFLGDRFFCPTT